MGRDRRPPQQVPGTAETPRLFLRPICLEDLDHLYRLNADPEVMRHIGKGVRDRQETQEHLERLVDHWAKHGFGLWTMILRDSGLPAGRCGLQHYDGTSEIELSFALAPEFWGRGLAVEAGQAALGHGFSVLGLERIIATARKANTRSRRVLEKLGMQPAPPRERYGHLVDVFAIERKPEAE
jgi:RimJ/RimL family protein N-acetyltransferase